VNLADLMKLKDWIYPEATEIDTIRDLKIIQNYLPEKGIILDAGGGIGRIAIELARLGYKVVLLDISRTALEFARREAEKQNVLEMIEFVEGDVCDLKFGDNTFDLVLALRDVINYSLDARKAVKELIRVLKENCYLIASFANKVFWLTKNFEVEKIERLIATEKMLTQRQLKDLFSDIEIEKIVGSGYCSGNIPIEYLIGNKERFIEIEDVIGDDQELMLACEYLVLIGKKVRRC